jgi:hypothetical protein
MKGSRVYPNENGQLLLKEGEYGINPDDGNWYACTPNGHLGGLANHTVEEHADKTITVSPSILVMTVGKKTVWHGYLERGEWREV